MLKDTKSRANLVHSIQQMQVADFNRLALELFQYQAIQNPIYNQYLHYLSVTPSSIQSIEKIPFLPIQLFKNHFIQSGQWTPARIFRSSGTTGSIPSQHFIKELNWYHQIAQKGFEEQYGKLENLCILGLLPSYLERSDSSLVEMVQYFMSLSRHPYNGFFLDDFEALAKKLRACQEQGQKCLLIGVSFALLDFAEQYPMDLSNIMVMETGGMKGRRTELTRLELHSMLKKAFQLKEVHSEYGMTELLSQAYSKGNGIFQTISTMNVLIRELNDPFNIEKTGKSGGINIIDLANIDSCAFIATEDIGKVYNNGTFEILGRMDASAIRGCNLMVADLE